MSSGDSKIFHENLRAALRAGAELEIGERWTQSDALTMNRLDQYISTPASADPGRFDGSVPPRLLAAQAVFDQLNAMDVVLTGLHQSYLERERAKKALRWITIYLWALIVTAAVCLGLFFDRVLPVVEQIRNDLRIESSAWNASGWLSTLVWIMAGLATIATVAMALGLVQRISFWFGGNRYVRGRLSASAIEIRRRLQEAGMNSESAVRWSCQLIGADAVIARQVGNAVGDSTQLRSIAEYHELNAARQYHHLKTTAPMSMVTLVGGTIALVVGVTVFWLIISMFGELMAGI